MTAAAAQYPPTYDALAGYARLSKNPDGTLLSVPRQIRAGNALATASGHTISKWFTDDNLSAWDETVYRPGWEDFLAALGTGQHDGALAYHLDRWSRNGSDSERLLSVTRRLGLPLITPQQVLDVGRNEDARLVFRLQSAVAINQSDRTERRVKEAKDAARAEGNLRTVLGGCPPVGYRDGDGDWVPDPAATAMLRDVAARILGGETLSEAYRAQLPVTIPAYGKVPARVITEKQVRGALQRPVTAGIMTARDGTHIEQVVDDPPLPKETWAAVRAVFAARKRGGRGPTASYPFGRILRCGKCRNQLTGSPMYYRGRAIPSYGCKNPHLKLGITQPCNGVSIPAADVHALLQATCEGWAQTSARFAAAAAHTARMAGVAGRHAELTAMIEGLRDNIADAMRSRNRGLISQAAYGQIREDLDSQVEQAQAELTTVEQVQASPLPAELEWDKMTGAEQCRLVIEALETPIVVLPGNGAGRRLSSRERLTLAVRG